VSADHVDLLVVGAGPAGIAAAVSAAELGVRVVLVDQGLMPGGQIWRRRAGASAPRAARSWLERLERRSVRVVGGGEIVDVDDGGVFVFSAAGESIRCRPAATVIATGARELFLPFPGWTLPNVVGAGGLQALLKGGLEVRGRRVVLAGSGPLLLPVAATAARAGARLAIVAEQTPADSLRAFTHSLWRSPLRLAAAGALRAGFLATRYAAGTWVVRADGDDRVREATLTDGSRSWRESCDYLAVGYGLVPNTELARLLGAATGAGGILVDARQATTAPAVFAAGECTGIGGAPLSIAEGIIAGTAAAGAAELPRSAVASRARERGFAARLASAFALRDEVYRLADADTVVCRCEDVRSAELGGVHDLREARLHGRAGMGACQGRVCGAALAATRGWSEGAVRPPLFPIPVSALIARAD
jgi:NADPH-dependent 2,4-dienoyl-CoA reductase/sulfur reductase-like enzyme